VSTNLEFSRWTEIFCDPMLTAATVDRMTHKSHIIDTNGSSYRLRQRLARTNAVGGPLTGQAE
ncbi:MAG: ATP-binding protein, partial [Firmicutes bacterium]|nr:ATP-binding protein [Bacillota bacterium]